MGYLSLYKTLSEHGADNSRLTPNISLITDENKLILTTKNNLNMTFNNINVVETADEMTNNIIPNILNKFPSITLTGMPGLKIYTDNTSQSKAENIKLYNAAQEYRDNFISGHGLDDTGQDVYMVIDSLILDNKTIDEYDGHYNYSIYIYNNRIVLFDRGGLNVLTIYFDGYVETPDYTPTPDYTGTPDYTEMPDIDTTSTTTTSTSTTTTSNLPDLPDLPDLPANMFNIFPTPTNTATIMPGLKIYTDNSDQSKAENIKLYNDARKWRKDYISYKGWSDNGRVVRMYIDALVIDGLVENDYNGIYDKYINIYDHYIAVYTLDGLLVLTIDSDGSVPETLTLTTTTTSIFNIFPTPTNTATIMPGLKIYTDNSDQSKAENIKLYNDARKWRKDYISYKRWSDTGQGIKMYIDALVIDGLAEDDYNGIYDKYINIYDKGIVVFNTLDGLYVLTIYSDGSVGHTPTITTI